MFVLFSLCVSGGLHFTAYGRRTPAVKLCVPVKEFPGFPFNGADGGDKPAVDAGEPAGQGEAGRSFRSHEG